MGSKTSDWRQKPFHIEKHTSSSVMWLEFEMHSRGMEKSGEGMGSGKPHQNQNEKRLPPETFSISWHVLSRHSILMSRQKANEKKIRPHQPIQTDSQKCVAKHNIKRNCCA